MPLRLVCSIGDFLIVSKFFPHPLPWPAHSSHVFRRVGSFAFFNFSVAWFKDILSVWSSIHPSAYPSVCPFINPTCPPIYLPIFPQQTPMDLPCPVHFISAIPELQNGCWVLLAFCACGFRKAKQVSVIMSLEMLCQGGV